MMGVGLPGWPNRCGPRFPGAGDGKPTSKEPWCPPDAGDYTPTEIVLPGLVFAFSYFR
jgi:hypothetical protein